MPQIIIGIGISIIGALEFKLDLPLIPYYKGDFRIFLASLLKPVSGLVPRILADDADLVNR